MSLGQSPFQGCSVASWNETVLTKTLAVRVWACSTEQGAQNSFPQKVSCPSSTLFQSYNEALNEAVLMVATWLLQRMKTLLSR